MRYRTPRRHTVESLVVEAVFTVADDLLRRAIAGIVRGAVLLWTAAGVAVGLTLLAASAVWQYAHPRDRAAVRTVTHGASSVLHAVPARIVSVVVALDRQAARGICDVVDWFDRERQRWELRQRRPYRVAIAAQHEEDEEDEYEELWRDTGNPVGRAA